MNIKELEARGAKIIKPKSPNVGFGKPAYVNTWGIRWKKRGKKTVMQKDHNIVQMSDKEEGK